MNSDDTNAKKDPTVEQETDDVVIEDIEEGENSALALKKLREKLKVAVTEKQQYLDGWQRTQADFSNYKKREKEERENLIKFSNEQIILDLIPALDSFDMAMANKESWMSAPENWRKGVEYIYSQFLSILEGYGVKQTNPVGEMFSTANHEPATLIPTEKADEDGKILAVIQKGYTLNGKEVRPAKVNVGELKK
ncbi:MAG: nucleotide exchange factor GrpE [Candidatus Pacebacteria bacterium]|nr:nucleotide exchange factor GrpE [Candidatus Paceibacterota bacterium]MDD5357157.1 nucleotide exchange factor GrpE [Candidatus Paceibacterota bacterium]